MDDSAVDEPGALAPPPPTIWVLIADDEISIAESLALIVETAGYSPLVAPNGQEAMEAARQHWPALVLTDMMMPRLDGAGFIAALRAEAEQTLRAMPPVILLTAGGWEHAQGAGADVVLEKPFDVEVVIQLLHDYLSPE